MSLGAGVVADVIIAGAMTVVLVKCRTGFSKWVPVYIFTSLHIYNTLHVNRTDSVIRTLIIYSINTGALTGCARLCVPSHVHLALTIPICSLCALLCLVTVWQFMKPSALLKSTTDRAADHTVCHHAGQLHIHLLLLRPAKAYAPSILLSDYPNHLTTNPPLHPTVFLNSLLATLNAREALRGAEPSGMVSVPLSHTSYTTHMSFVDRSRYSQSTGAHKGGEVSRIESCI